MSSSPSKLYRVVTSPANPATSLRSKIRIQDCRAKPIDLLAKYISAEEDLNAIEMHEPYTYLNGLTVTDLEDLLADIKAYNKLDTSTRNQDFWSDIIVIDEDELSKLRKLDARWTAEKEGPREVAESRDIFVLPAPEVFIVLYSVCFYFGVEL